jgi:murein L,D-transpeptidase YcbB/YkuD
MVRKDPMRSVRARLTSGALLAALTWSVACAPADPVTQRVEVAEEVAAVFAAPEPWSPRTLGERDLADFLVAQPQYASDSTELAAFYARRDQQYAWLVQDALSSNAEAFVALAGLGAGPIDSLDFACATCVRDAELRLTAEFLRFARRDYGGHFDRDPRELGWFIPRAKKDYARLLDSLAAGTMDISAIEPVHPGYAPLRAQIASWQRLTEQPWDTLALPRGVRKLVPDDTAALVPPLRARLALLGDHPTRSADSSANEALLRYDSALVDAVRRFQRRHGLLDDGIVGAGVLRALNVTPAERLRTVLINMERLRWVPDHPAATAIIVNIPEFRLHVLEEGREVLAMPIVVGAAATRTVIFSDSVTSVVFSPTWTVPASITRKEILPALKRDPSYLARRQMEIIGGSATLPIIRQRPGPQNALGAVKFLFPNAYDIYMHDTPSRGLFAREQRAFSHGCIRLGDPKALATYLLRSDSTWTAERMARAMSQPREQVVRLRTPMPVYLVYFTAWVDADGVLHFRDDVYGHDARLSAELFANGN